MFSFRNLIPCGYSNGGTLDTAATYTYVTGTSFPAICRLIPVDNVEYVMGNSYGNYYTFNDIQKIDFLEGKKKWLDQKGFINSAGPVKK